MSATDPSQAAASGSIALGGLVAALLKIGGIGFGDGMAVTALKEDESLRQHRLVSMDELAHGVGLAQILGSRAANVSVFLGFGGLRRLSRPLIGLVIPLSDLYSRYRRVPALQGAVVGLDSDVMAPIVTASWSIGREAVRSWPAALVSLAALAAGVARVNAA